MYATLVRREGETLDQLMGRLDVAIGQSLRSGEPVNELPGAEFFMGRGTGKRRKR
jgi:hypothetical protein